MKPRAWSHSALDKFITCPRQYYETTITKAYTESSSAVMDEGNRVHKAFENRVADGVVLPPDLETHEGYLRRLADRPGIVRAEQKLALNKRLQPCTFFAEDTWFRGIIDYENLNENEALIVDYKTGKKKPKQKQLALFAIYTLSAHPQIDIVDTRFYWTIDQTETRTVYGRKQLPDLWGEFTPDLKQFVEAFKTNTWQPRPSGLCNGWCPVTDCEHWAPKRK